MLQLEVDFNSVSGLPISVPDNQGEHWSGTGLPVTQPAAHAAHALDCFASPAQVSSWSQGESGSVLRVLGEGPWHIDWPHLSKQPWAFLWGGVLAGPKELASYEVVEGSDQLRIRIPPGVVTKGTVYSVTMTGGAAAAAAAAVVAVVL